MRALRLLSHLLFGVLAAGALTICAVVCVGTIGLVGKPFTGVSFVAEGLVNPVGLQSWGGERAGLQVWDRVIAVDGELVFGEEQLENRAFSRPVGSPIVYQVEGRDGSRRFIEMRTRLFTVSDLVRSHTSQALLGLIFVVVAVLLYFLRPGTAEAWAFFAFFASLGVSLASVVDLTLLWQLPPFYPWVGPLLGPLGLVLVGIITRAYRTWEGARALEGTLEQGERGETVTVLPRSAPRPLLPMWVLTVALFVIGGALSYLLGSTRPDADAYVALDAVFYSWLALCTVLGLGLLLLGYVRARSPRRRARIRQILWAWPVGAGIPIVNLFVGHVLHLSPMSLIWNAFILLVPLSTADAIVRHDLLRLNASARRLVGGLTVAAVMGILLGVALWSAVQFLKLDDAAGMVALAALMFAVAAPLTHRVQAHVEGLLRSARYDSGRLLAEFTARASTATHIRDATAQLEEALSRSMKPTFFELYRLDRAEGRLFALVRARASLPVGDALAPLLERSEPTVIDDDQPAPMALAGAALAVRLAVANEPVGLLVVGTRIDGTPFDGSDVAFVASLAGPLAAALVNTLAYEQVEAMNRALEARVAQRTAELEESNHELAQLNARKDELVATVSHDFRSPLAVIRQNAQTIVRDLPRLDHDDLRMFVEGIQRQEQRLTALCTNLLDLARLKQGVAAMEEVDIAALAKSLVDGFGLRASSQGVELEVLREDAVHVLVRGDHDRLGQVLQNLIDNALKFTPAGGRIEVRLKDGGRASDGGRGLLVEVHDTGCGVPHDALSRLFEPFFQVPRQTHAGQGSGLGLAIVKAVVEAHGGTIDVESVEGKGTCFRVQLRAAPLAATSGVDKDAAGQGTERGSS